MTKEILVIAIVLVLGILLGSLMNFRTVIIEENIPFDVRTPPAITVVETGDLSNSTTAEVKIPAVDDNSRGLITYMVVQALPGSGKTLANIDNILFFTDTQNSIRVARHVAKNVTGKDLEEWDLVYTIIANASVITGPSAGGSIAVATIAALQNKKLNPRVMMTGSITHDGKIRSVGQVKEKARAAMDVGAEIFLVPPSQSQSMTYSTRNVCEVIGETEFCTIETVQEEVDISEQLDITIKEVSDINEALEYYLTD